MRMTKINALIFSIVTSFMLFTGTLAPVSAATPSPISQSKGVSLTTSPIVSELSAKPGTSTTTTLQVMNNTTAPLQINLVVQTFRAYGTSGKAQIITPKSGDSFINWVTFSKDNFVAQPGVWTPIQMTINVPSYAGLGYYYAILFKPSIPIAQGKHLNTFKSSNAILVLLNAQSSNEKPKLELTSFTSEKHIYEYLPATFDVTVHNVGNIFLPPSGNIFISKSNEFSNKNVLSTLDINPAQGNVLPGSNRIYTSQWTDGAPVFVPKTLGSQPITDSQGNTIYQLKWNFDKNKFRFGKYYAKLVLVYNNGTRDVPTVSVVSFWVIPWKLIILAILILVTIGGLIYAVFHLLKKSKKQSKWRA